jgi:hypothetical protein
LVKEATDQALKTQPTQLRHLILAQEMESFARQLARLLATQRQLLAAVVEVLFFLVLLLRSLAEMEQQD